MDAKIMGLDDLFCDFPVSLSHTAVPAARTRGGEISGKTLWDDVRNIADRIVSPTASDEILPHFMGAIVLQQAETPFGGGCTSPGCRWSAAAHYLAAVAQRQCKMRSGLQ